MPIYVLRHTIRRNDSANSIWTSHAKFVLVLVASFKTRSRTSSGCSSFSLSPRSEETSPFVRSAHFVLAKNLGSPLRSDRHIAATMSSKRPFPVRRSRTGTILCSNRSYHGGKSQEQASFFVTSGRGPLVRPNVTRSGQLNWSRGSDNLSSVHSRYDISQQCDHDTAPRFSEALSSGIASHIERDIPLRDEHCFETVRHTADDLFNLSFHFFEIA